MDAAAKESSAINTRALRPITSSPRLSIAMMIFLSLVLLALCFAIPTFFNDRGMRHYLGSAVTVSYRYNTDVSSPTPDNSIDRSMVSIPAVLDITDAPDEKAGYDQYRRFLTMAGPSTKEMRQWLNQSLVEDLGWLEHRHDASLSSQPPSRRNTVSYRACCGLGHRLARLENAAHVALLYEATLDVVWNDCGPDTFQQLFGPEPFHLGQSQDTLDGHDTTTEAIYHWTFANDVPTCYGVMAVHQRSDLCSGIQQGTDKAGSSLYQELLDRYVRRDVVQNFVETHFAGKTSVGMHIRAGNNETGDFMIKNRQIDDMNGFVKINAERVRDMVTPPNADRGVLFVATDTPSYVEVFRNELNGTLPVLELQQIRAEEGRGVLFGAHGAPIPKGEMCLEGWHAALQDMMILALTDIVFATTYSSFTRTMPRVMALSRPNRPISESFCENWKQSDLRMVCYHSFDSFNANPPPMTTNR